MISTVEIDKILATFKTKVEKINYLNNKIYEYEQRYQESLILDHDRLERLKALTEAEEEKYQQLVDRGGLPRYFNKGDNDLYAQRKKIEGRQKLDKAFAETLKVLRSKIINDVEEIPLTKSTEHLEELKEKKSNLFIDSFFNDEIFKSPQYNSLKDIISRHGFFSVNNEAKEYRIYNPSLAYLFTSIDLKVTDRNLKTEVIFDSKLHLDIFLSGYEKGEEYFEKEFGISPNIMYGENANLYIRDLHENYYHTYQKDLGGSWIRVKTTMPCIITHQLIHTLGYYTGVVSRVESLAGKYPKLFQTFDKCEHNLPPTQTETKTEPVIIEIKPVLKKEAVQTVFEILKDFFSGEQQAELKLILETGNHASQHLIFLDNGNRLADAFKQLKKTDAITGCDQKQLEAWIHKNFKYRFRDQIKEFTIRYLNDIISTNKDKCQNPILNATVDKTTGEIKITKA